MEKTFVFAMLMIFNTIYGISAISVLSGGIYLIIKIDFNEYIIIMIIIGLIMTLISIMGFCSWKKPRLLFFYMIHFGFFIPKKFSLRMSWWSPRLQYKYQ